MLLFFPELPQYLAAFQMSQVQSQPLELPWGVQSLKVHIEGVQYASLATAEPALTTTTDILDLLRILERPRTLGELFEAAGCLRPEDGCGITLDAVGQSLRSTLAAFQEIGAIICIEDCEAQPSPANEIPEKYSATIEENLASIANMADTMRGEMAAFGPEIQTQPIGESIYSAVRAINSAALILKAKRVPYLEYQLQKLGLQPDAMHLRLNLGAGPHRLNSWINVDIYPADLALDLRWGLPFRDGSVDFVFMSHVLEHFVYKDEALQILRDVRRVLSPGGIVRIVVPDIMKYLDAISNRNDEFFAGRESVWPGQSGYTRVAGMLLYAGAGWVNDARAHKFGYDFETLRALLLEAGFGAVERSGYMESAHLQLRVDDVSRIAGSQYGASHYSLFVEASGDRSH